MLFNSPTDAHAHRAHQALLSLIQQEADRRGGISFARFMQLALYAPEQGFYERASKSIGHRGDFFTSVSVGPLFGELLACQFTAWLGEPGPNLPVIVEAGAHDGRLAADILNAVQLRAPALAEALEYWLIEPSAARRAWQAETLHPHAGRVRWFQSWTELSSFGDTAGQPWTGVIFANELLDAFPVHRLSWAKAESRWREMGVRSAGQGLAWITQELSEETAAYADAIRNLATASAEDLLWPGLPDELLAVLPDGFTIEVCPGAMNWWKEAARALRRGWLMTLDYGHAGPDFLAPHRNEGTARAYHQHQLSTDLLAQPGAQDLTAHVNFSVINRVGEAAGLRTMLLSDQSTFLTRVAANHWAGSNPAPFDAAQLRQFQTLTHPTHLGRSFKVLVQTRDAPTPA